MQLSKTNIKLAKKSTRLQVRWFAHSVCGHFGLWPFRFVTVPVCSRFGLWPFRFVAVSVCGHSGLWPFRLVAFRSVAVSVCGLFGFGRFGLWPLWPETVHKTCQTYVYMWLCTTKPKKQSTSLGFFMVRLRSSAGPTVGIRSIRVNSTHP